MKPSDKEWIEKRAYSLWEEEGKPHGKDDAHWQQAHREFYELSQSAQKAKAGALKRASQAAKTQTAKAPTTKTQAAKTRQSPEAEMADAPQDPKPAAATKRKRKII
ncbi:MULTISPECIES: DUF2934 domain-containing protein [Rhizobium/Agrobacterium group]|uniref:DUF2934 domain-containing protein n=1 Tax=Rhizobium/Agrobacterium group TaxID=227290 RepID=UPI0012E779EC|nr:MULTISPECIES: DUF2934 domain-containing protein [Rhizobium/Agrobacterium group]MCF1472450.1 DUF2934 domain-containing protein [Allorhizobium ampelinum]MVA49650.1 DUF2934 domain-containing protein [Agrobacterium vitis]NSZ54367.1 DUF2934 domain-containing protein [Agrobacterium vitis]NTA33360.1 DUF2934 domain-containing protein [Agrobacterium vitis]